MSPKIHLYNTLTRTKEALEPQQPDRVTMYVCGPTVYNYAHLGNARPAVVFDVLARLLRHTYPQVMYACNFTDVDDKINAAALTAGVPIGTITMRYIDAYHEDMHALGVLTPDLEPRVTEHIPDIVTLIQTLIARGHAYEAQHHVLFDVASFPAYGQLSGHKPQNMLAGARVEVAPYKRNPLDFVLWKPSTPELPRWNSPWGRGRPGWHIECTAMIGRHLGQTLDIHGGGQDLIFPHHENEIAQGTCIHDTLYCRTWVHNSFVTVDGQKMSKSLGNVLLVRDLLRQAPGEAIRLALLSTHYRHPLDWNRQRLVSACQTLRRLYLILEKFDATQATSCVGPDAEFLKALANDLNTPAALAHLHRLAIALENARTDDAQAHLKARLLASASLLGLWQHPAAQALTELPQRETLTVSDAVDPVWVEKRVAERTQTRARHDFDLADTIRRELSNAGITVEDTPEGSTWHIQSEMMT
ncbi:cysteine--tRNA ligase [Parapusillimonas granuli]|uniref:Cysteine--tRNA ligase n=1 Tax=Parapusillimonas granuli TaxID=380911 RepID=A0A853FYR8_9BURK|nr:cysteine--tRNA ligase [Parapusillimonas granuli]MBB5217490.1 cysteinyl-tRNA synthetase [Parapusillimonas granuli]NYT51254.1 cysteine--tRNA ligase [Parapusillimonas granuli]NYT80267.1 cysteine--tRNA ligase [Alcaligenaceae bacterium]